MTEMKNESIKITGSVRKQLFGENGTLKYDHTDSNLTVTVGKTFLTTWLTALTQSIPFMSWIGLGTNNTAATLGDTNLVSPLATRIQGTLTDPAKPANNTTAVVPFTVTDITDGTHMVISNTAGMSNGDTIVQGTNTTTITTVVNGTDLVVGSTAGWVVDMWQNVASFGPGVDTGTLREAGLFSLTSGGTMFARQTFGDIVKAAGDTLVLTWQLTLN